MFWLAVVAVALLAAMQLTLLNIQRRLLEIETRVLSIQTQLLKADLDMRLGVRDPLQQIVQNTRPPRTDRYDSSFL